MQKLNIDDVYWDAPLAESVGFLAKLIKHCPVKRLSGRNMTKVELFHPVG